METIEELLQDDVEQKFHKLKDKREKRKKKWRRLRRVTLALILCFGILYYVSDYSKVKRLYVVGNRFYDMEDVFSIAGISYETRYLFTPGFYIEWQLEKDPFIKQADVSVKWNGIVTMNITEETIIGYVVDNDGQTFAILGDGKKYAIQESQLESIVYYPLISGLSEENISLLAKSLMNSENPVKDKYISMISEVRPYETSYDNNMVKLIMQDGNTIYSSYAGLGLLNYYTSVLERLNSTHVCLIVQESTHSIISTECSS